jgi:hypothetical protein
MSDNSERLWLQQTINKAAIIRASEAIERLGAALPCKVVAVSGSIVTVSFEVNSIWTLPNITIPKAEGQWIRSPTQIGDLGLTMPASVYLGGISGLGGGTASAASPGNLEALVWVPVASTAFPTSLGGMALNINQAQVYGPAGAVVQTQDGTSVVNVAEGQITAEVQKTGLLITDAGISLVINGVVVSQWGSSGMVVTGTIQATQDIIASTAGANISLTNHVQTNGGGTGNSGPPAAGT